MSRYFVYVRKSTDENKRQLLSLDGQTRELRDLAAREQLTIVDFLEEMIELKQHPPPAFFSHAASARQLELLTTQRECSLVQN